MIFSIFGIIHGDTEYSWSSSNVAPSSTYEVEWESNSYPASSSSYSGSAMRSSETQYVSAPISTVTTTGSRVGTGSTSGGIVSGGGATVQYTCPTGYSLRGTQCYNELCNTFSTVTPSPPKIIVPQQPMLNCIIQATATQQYVEEIRCPANSVLM